MARGPIFKSKMCASCGIRHGSRPRQLCEPCYKTDVEQRRLAREAEELSWSLWTPPPMESPRPKGRTFEAGGLIYEVAWDGSMDGAQARGIPWPHERASSDSQYRIARDQDLAAKKRVCRPHPNRKSQSKLITEEAEP